MSAIARGALDRSVVERAVREILTGRLGGTPSLALRASNGDDAGATKPKLVVNISARHMHVTQDVLEVLFGAGARLTVHRPLYQDGQFASEQTVTIIGPRHRTITNLRILGPCRTLNQIELSFTDGVAMGLDLPVRMIGDVKGTPGCIVLGPKGHVVLKEGVVRAMRHAHMHPREAEYYGVKNGDRMVLDVDSSCPMKLNDVVARIDPALKLEVHIDTDEGNACDLTNAKRVELLKQ